MRRRTAHAAVVGDGSISLVHTRQNGARGAFGALAMSTTAPTRERLILLRHRCMQHGIMGFPRPTDLTSGILYDLECLNRRRTWVPVDPREIG